MPSTPVVSAPHRQAVNRIKSADGTTRSTSAVRDLLGAGVVNGARQTAIISETRMWASASCELPTDRSFGIRRQDLEASVDSSCRRDTAYTGVARPSNGSRAAPGLEG